MPPLRILFATTKPLTSFGFSIAEKESIYDSRIYTTTTETETMTFATIVLGGTPDGITWAKRQSKTNSVTISSDLAFPQ